MQRVDKESCSAHHSPHCFPSMEKSNNQSINPEADVSNVFQPLYKHPGGNAGQGNGISDANPSGSPQQMIEEVREKSFQKGLEAGKAEACKVVQQELKEPVIQFLKEKDRFENCFAKITDHYPGHIVALAFAIAKKIVGDELQLDMDRLEPICRQLQSCLTRQYEISLKFNNEDIQSLGQLLECMHPQWQKSSAMVISGEDTAQKGGVHLVGSEETLDNLKEKIRNGFNDILTGS